MMHKQIFRLSLVLLVVIIGATEAFAQSKKEVLSYTPWLNKQGFNRAYIDSAYPADLYLRAFESIDTKRRTAEEQTADEKKLKQRLAEKISRSIQVDVHSSSVQIVSEELSSSTATGFVNYFGETTSISVSAHFQFALDKTAMFRKELFAIRVVNRKFCAKTLMVGAVAKLETCVPIAAEAVKSGNSSSLPELEKISKEAVQEFSSAIWLDHTVDQGAFTELSSKLSTSIQSMRVLDSELGLKRVLSGVSELIQQGRYTDAIKKINQEKITHPGRTELDLSLETVRDAYRQHVLSPGATISDEPKSWIKRVKMYLSYFPEDPMIREKLGELEVTVFDKACTDIELAIREDEYDRAKRLYEILERLKRKDPHRFERIKHGLYTLRIEVTIISLEQLWHKREYREGWRTIGLLTASHPSLLDDNEIKSFKKKFGRECKKLDILESRNRHPYRFALALGTDFRANSIVTGAMLTDPSKYKVNAVYSSYSFSAYFRSISEQILVAKRGKTYDRSKTNLIGIRYSLLKFDSNRWTAHNTGEPPTFSTDNYGWELGLDLILASVWHVGIGTHGEGTTVPGLGSCPDDGPESSICTTNTFYAVTGFQLPFQGRRGMTTINFDGWFYSAAYTAPLDPSEENPRIFNLSLGIAWAPFFSRAVRNKRAIRKKYK